MQQIGIRELRQQASRWLREVEQGRSFEITDRGRPVAVLLPIAKGSALDRLRAQGRSTPALGDLLDLGDPLPAREGEPLPSEVLEQMRADER